MSDHKPDVDVMLATGEAVSIETPFPVVAERFPEPKLASEAIKEASERPEELIRVLSCGDAGGLKLVKVSREVDGETIEELVPEPCDNPSSFGIPGSRYGITPGRCHHHTEEKLAEKAKRKATFLDAYCESPEAGIGAAAELAGVSRMTPYNWEMQDPEFKKNFDALRMIAEAILTDMVEETIVTRLLDPKSGADTLRMWWLQNRRGQKWKTNKSLSPNPFGGESAPNISGGNHVWMIGNQKVSF